MVKPAKKIKHITFKNHKHKYKDTKKDSMTLPQKLEVEELKGQHTIMAQKKRYQRANNIEEVVFTSEFDALVQSRNPLKPYHVVFREDNKAKRKLDCECESFLYGVVRNEKFECKHIVAARNKWDRLKNE